VSYPPVDNSPKLHDHRGRWWNGTHDAVGPYAETAARKRPAGP
jgi:hypothetical protein